MFKMNGKDFNLEYAKTTAILVRALRNMFGLSQNDLSNCAKIARPTISRLEKLDTDGVKAETLEKSLAFFSSQGVEFRFDKDGVTVHVPMRTLVKASIIIQENTQSRGGVLEAEKDNPEKKTLDSHYDKLSEESMLEYILRLDQEMKKDD